MKQHEEDIEDLERDIKMYTEEVATNLKWAIEAGVKLAKLRASL